MTTKILIIGATGRVGSKVVAALESAAPDVQLRLSSSNFSTVEQWRGEGKEAALLDLNQPETFQAALDSVERVFLLTGYTADMLYQSKQFIDAAIRADIRHVVHLGVFTSRNDKIPHFVWHDLIESYIEASGIAWTHIHPNVIADSVLEREPSIWETGEFSVSWGAARQGWVFTQDIADVAAAVLREGPHKHHGKQYWLSTEVLTGKDVAAIISDVAGREIRCIENSSSELASYVKTIEDTGARAYMESAVVTMKLAESGQMDAQTVVRDDVLTVLGRPGISVADWARKSLSK